MERHVLTTLSPPIFRQILARSNELKKRGVSVLDIKAVPWQSPGENVIAAAQQAARSLTRAPASGLPELRQAIAERIRRESGVAVDPDSEVLTTNGCMEALWLAMFGLLDRGDEVLFTAPGFIADRLATLAGARPVFTPLGESDGWRLSVDAFERQVTSKTRMLYLCNPDNPTGRVATRDELIDLLEFCERHDLLCLADEAFDHQIFDGRKFTSAISFSDWRDRVLLAQSFTKSFAMPQWRLGSLVGPARIVEHLTELHEWMMLDLPVVTQAAAAAAASGPQDWVHQMGREFEANRDALLPILKGIDGISFVVPEGGAFFFVNVKGLGVGGETVARRLLNDFGIPVNPGHNYHSRGYVRLAFGADEVTLGELGRRLPVALDHISTRQKNMVSPAEARR